MRIHFLTSTILAASILALPATRVSADAGDFVAGAIIGGVLGHAVRQQPQRRVYTTKRKTYVQKRPSIPATQSGREIQSSLNYFGFDAGTVDGQLGRKSRNAISSYQSYMGYAATGQLTPFEQNLLVSSWTRAQAGGYATQQLAAASPDGMRGLLRTWRAEMAGNPTGPAAPTPPTVMAAAPVAAAAVPAAAALEAATELPLPEAIPEADATLPNLFGGTQTTQASLASHCNKVSLLTSGNGGFTTQAAMTDAGFVMSEQFCLARTYAIATGEELTARTNASPDQISQHCAAYGDRLAPMVQALSVAPRDEVIRQTAAFVLEAGVPPADLVSTAKVCLANGYRTDDMDEALGSALILATLGEKGYAELMGHHLGQGFGTSQRVDLAMDWYEMAGQAAPVFAPGQPERADLIRAAAAELGGTPADKVVPVSSDAAAPALPTLDISQ
ncbi:Peptidoglycan-binding domain 1 protein [Oceaniovalibus guishaninsula JLT2003]|uniref:Peptidoglycan-binding domain 1 protein n=1 Tax=Oceaniovalibus guishaninsula JLT2003 TaxID=1231392 RepID=K2GS80_9RHOB|nr:peptidoglycan-binding domain-containing protein [Oceaniovalibus guishaninsula]EKE45471.1 Peptidoglycan-binding domain 1 protein [Oceaniovalibus guishaninsula JLT2003]